MSCRIMITAGDGVAEVGSPPRLLVGDDRDLKRIREVWGILPMAEMYIREVVGEI